MMCTTAKGDGKGKTRLGGGGGWAGRRKKQRGPLACVLFWLMELIPG